jgi:hypothetical protein
MSTGLASCCRVRSDEPHLHRVAAVLELFALVLHIENPLAALQVLVLFPFPLPFSFPKPTRLPPVKTFTFPEGVTPFGASTARTLTRTLKFLPNFATFWVLALVLEA